MNIFIGMRKEIYYNDLEKSDSRFPELFQYFRSSYFVIDWFCQNKVSKFIYESFVSICIGALSGFGL